MEKEGFFFRIGDMKHAHKREAKREGERERKLKGDRHGRMK
jgi:hypothetical protein